MKHSVIYNSRNIGQSVKVDHPNICSKQEFIYECTAAVWHIMAEEKCTWLGWDPEGRRQFGRLDDNIKGDVKEIGLECMS